MDLVVYIVFYERQESLEHFVDQLGQATILATTGRCLNNNDCFHGEKSVAAIAYPKSMQLINAVRLAT